MLEYKVVSGEPLPLGRRWERYARRMVFDISEWVRAFGPGRVRLLHQRQGDAAPYPVDVARTDADGNADERTGTRVLWDVGPADTEKACHYGRAELRYYAGTENSEEFLVKSELYKTSVLNALGASLADAPEAERFWLDEILDALRSMDERVTAARAAANAAADDANTARAAALAARVAREDAETARDEALRSPSAASAADKAETGAKALSDDNAVSADSGTASLKRQADPAPAYDELVNAILFMGAGIS